MNLSEYQDGADRTLPPHPKSNSNVAILTLGLAGEVGEIVELIKKELRDGISIESDKLIEELGDLLWYVSAIASVYNLDMSDVAEQNLVKLKKRYPNRFVRGGGIR